MHLAQTPSAECPKYEMWVVNWSQSGGAVVQIDAEIKSSVSQLHANHIKLTQKSPCYLYTSRRTTKTTTKYGLTSRRLRLLVAYLSTLHTQFGASIPSTFPATRNQHASVEAIRFVDTGIMGRHAMFYKLENIYLLSMWVA